LSGLFVNAIHVFFYRNKIKTLAGHDGSYHNCCVIHDFNKKIGDGLPLAWLG
jgi:hypothetical protein